MFPIVHKYLIHSIFVNSMFPFISINQVFTRFIAPKKKKIITFQSQGLSIKNKSIKQLVYPRLRFKKCYLAYLQNLLNVKIF